MAAFDVDGMSLAVVNWRQRSPWSAQPLHTGIEYRVRLNAEEPRAALDLAIHKVEYINNILSATHGVAIAEAIPLISIDVDPASVCPRFAQPFTSLPTEVIPTRAFVYGVVASFVTARESLQLSERTAVDRALWHVRKAAELDELVQRFTELWVGLDGLNAAIQLRHGLPHEQIQRACENCGATTATTIVSTGIKYAITELARYKGDEWKTARMIRQWILHGRPGFNARDHDFPKLTGVLRHALVSAIADLMRLSEDDLAALLRVSLRVADGPAVLLWGTFPQMRPDEILLGSSVPRLELAQVLARSALPNDLAVTLGDVRLRFKGKDVRGEIKLEGAELRTYRDPEQLAFGSGYSGFRIATKDTSVAGIWGQTPESNGPGEADGG